MSVLSIMPKPTGPCQPWLCKEEQDDVTFESGTDRIAAGNPCPVLVLTGQAGCWLITRRCWWIILLCLTSPFPLQELLHCELPPRLQRNTSKTGLSSGGSSVSSSHAPELRGGNGQRGTIPYETPLLWLGQSPWDKEIKESGLSCLKYKEVKSDISLSTSETKTWCRRSVSSGGGCSKIKAERYKYRADVRWVF